MNDNEYEAFVASAYRELISAEKGEVFLGKAYQGKSGHIHKIDVSLEIRIAGVDILVLVECKYYGRRVEVGEVLEFAQRLYDVSAHKGIMVTTVGFQEGAFKVSKSHRIALIIAVPSHNRVDWENVTYLSDDRDTNDAYSKWLGARPDTGCRSDDRDTNHSPKERQLWDDLNFTLQARNIVVSDDSSLHWRDIIASLLVDDSLCDFDYYAEKRAAKHAEYLSRLNDQAQNHAPDGRCHTFQSSVCAKCGGSIEAIRHFDWWVCKYG